MNAMHPCRQMTQACAHHVDALNVAQDPSIATATPQQLERWRLVQRRALFEWNAARPASRAFLAQCGLPAHLSRGLRAAGSSYLLVPQRDCMGELWALQYLPPRFRPARVNPRAADRPLRMVNPREAGLHFWKDPVDWAPPYFDVPAFSMPSWPFNDPGYQMFPVLNLAVAGSGGGDPSTGVYPAQMLVDYVRVW